MESIDFIVLQTLSTWLKTGHSALLVTVIRTWGSSPRPIGSIMAICDNGSVIGSISGGCIEEDLITKYSDEIRAQAELPIIKTLKYGVSAEEAHQFGLPCGGSIELLLEYQVDVNQLTQLMKYLNHGKLVRRQVDLITGQVIITPHTQPETLEINETHLSNCFGPSYRLFLIGAGQMSEYLATMARFSGFKVTVCDPRKEFLQSWSVPDVEVIQGMPEDILPNYHIDRRTAIIALTHDPKIDDLPLLFALNSDAFYIGAIGSRRNSDARKERMIQFFDQTDASLQRLHSPIGIYIGSKTPAEIAVSIMAELISVMNNVELPKTISVRNAKDLQENRSS